jgi:hypothetical protein
MNRLVLLVLAGIMLCCFWFFSISLPHSAPHVSLAYGGANVEHVERGANAPAPLPDGSYPLTLPEEPQETDRPPVNTYLLTMLVLACYFGAIVGWMLAYGQGQRAFRFVSLDHCSSFGTALENRSSLGMFRL